MSNNDEKRFRKACKSLLDIYFNAQVFGHRTGVAETTVESDGRKVKKMLRLLQERRILTEDKLGNYSITEKVLDQFEPVKPDLLAIFKTHTYVVERFERGDFHNEVMLHGVPTRELDEHQKAYVLLHPEEFGFIVYGYGRYEEFEFGSKPQKEDIWNSTLCIFTEEYDEYMEGLVFDNRVRNSMYENVAWGLRNLCGVTEADSRFINSSRRSDVMPFSGRGSTGPRFTEENDWVEEMTTATKKVTDALAHYTQKLDALHRIEKQVALYGGWEKFRTDFRERVVEELKAKDAEEAEKARADQEGASA